MIGTITLNPSIDQNILVDRLVKDDANRAKAIHVTAGGKGINVSKVVRELGGRTKAYALLGGFTGEYLKDLARPLDFQLVAEPVRGSTRVNTVLTDLKDDTQTRVSAPGPVISAGEVERFTRRLLAARPKPFVWALGGSICPGMRPSVYRQLIRRLQKNGTPCVLDTDGEALKLGVEARPFMIKPNEYEMQRLCGRPLKSMEDYLLAARHWVRAGVGLVVVSLGAKGALFADAGQLFHASSPAVEVRSNVGAGDSLIGGVLWGLRRKMTLAEAARWGIAASCSAILREAPRLCLKSDIPGLLRRVKVREL